MAEKDVTTSSNGEEEEDDAAWGTLQELLLVSAVSRHGTKDWDAIAMELRRRMNHHAFSSVNCKQKYIELKLRFDAAAAVGDAITTAVDGKMREYGNENENELIRMVDELRKLRVEELRREVQRHDVSIVSLQLKLKRLEKEREGSLLLEKAEKREGASDLDIKPDGNAIRTGENGDETERSPEKVLAAGDSAEDRSFHESNSTNHKAENHVAHDERESKLKREPEGGEREKASYPVRKGEMAEPNRASRPGELRESVSESKRVGGKEKDGAQQQQQSSDVQSSASLSKKKRRRFRGIGGGGSSGDELEAEEVSPANKRISLKSQPLIRFLEILRSHKHGSVFQRRLPSQETEKYRNLIRQHMDLDTVQFSLEKGIYCHCHSKFYRDLLLIFTNAMLFYRKNSAEHIAARELRKLVIEEIAQRTHKPRIIPIKPDPEPQHLEPVVKKPRSSTTMVVCRRRSSTSMQPLSESMKKEASVTTAAANNNNNKVENGRDEKEKPHIHHKRVDGNSNSTSLGSRKEEGEKGVGVGVGVGGVATASGKKVITKERTVLRRGDLRMNTSNGKKMSEKMSNGSKNNNKEESSEGEGEPLERRKVNGDQEKQEKGTTNVLKKQGVANFLKRMKQNSPPSQEKVKKNDSEEEENEKEGDKRRREKAGNSNSNSNTNNNNNNNNSSNIKKKGGNPKRNTREVEVEATRRTSGRRGERETVASRRVNGRPPKRKAAMVSSVTPDSGKGGRLAGKAGGEKSKKKPRR